MAIIGAILAIGVIRLLNKETLEDFGSQSNHTVLALCPETTSTCESPRRETCALKSAVFFEDERMIDVTSGCA